MKVTNLFRTATLGLALGAAFVATSAQALPILSFGQTGNVNTVTGTRSGSTTTITTNSGISITQIDAALATPLAANLTFTLTSTSAAISIADFITQNFSGTFCISAGASCTGTSYLQGSLVDVAFGQNTAFNLNASTPPSGNVIFFSDVIVPGDLGEDRGASISFANVTPGLSIVNNTIDSFTSSVSGTFSANVNAVPEPVSMALLGVGLIGLGAIRRNRA